jgi:hypothetical protein
MAKYFASDRGVRAVEIEGARTGTKRVLKPDAKGFYNVESKMDAKALQQSGFVEASLMGTTNSSVGYNCTECGFGSWFAVCGKCGHDNEGKNA